MGHHTAGFLWTINLYQFGRMLVLEEARTMDYVTNHNMITMAMTIFKTLKMAAEREDYSGNLFALIWLSFGLSFA